MRRICMILLAGAVSLAAASCGGGDSSPAEQVKEAAGDVGEQAKEAVDKAGDTAGEMAKDAGGMLASLKSEWSGKLSQFDDRLGGLKASAAALGNEELNGYVATIETKLGEAKDALAGLGDGDIDLTAIRNTMTSRMGELGGLFQAAEDKVQSLKADAGGH